MSLQPWSDKRNLMTGERCIFGMLSGPKWSKPKPKRRRDESRRPHEMLNNLDVWRNGV